jgi:AraC-like DNA-binding protein
MTALPLLDQLAACTMAGSARSAERQRAMLINLFALLRDVQADAQPAGLSIQRQAHLRQWLAEHFQHHPTAEDLARCIGLSLHYFRQQFHKSFACTPREWIRDERLRFAAELLLDSDESVADIAEHCGYRSVSSFSRLFSTCFGCGPKQWRQTADRSALVRVDRLTPQASAR